MSYLRLLKFMFEVEEDAKIWQVNVNNYLAIDPKKVT